MKTTTPAIEFRDVSVSFDDVAALRHIGFALPPGEMICITGDSQAGKSVLLRLAIGLLQPDEGEVLIDGHDISQLEETELLALRGERMGMVFQDAALFTSQSVYENAEYRMSERNCPEEETRQAVMEVLTFVGLQDELDKQAEELSGGMKRRVEIARALVGWPSIMLFDEPTAGLDPINAYQVLDLIIRARDLHGISSLVVTKALHEIPYLASHRAQQDAQGNSTIVEGDAAQRMRVLLLEKGQIAFFGSPQEFAESALPAVQHQLHPVTSANHERIEVNDPWDHSRQSKDHLLS